MLMPSDMEFIEMQVNRVVAALDRASGRPEVVDFVNPSRPDKSVAPESAFEPAFEPTFDPVSRVDAIEDESEDVNPDA